MTNQNHPITPPFDLVQQWINEGDGFTEGYFATQAAQWGADQELEACCKYMQHEDFHGFATELRAARRPKAPTLNSLALQMLSTIEQSKHFIPEITDTIRKALEALPND